MSLRPAAYALIIACVFAAPLRADVYELETGGRVEGTLLEKTPEGHFVVKTAAGAIVALPRDDIASVDAQDPAAAEYEQRSRSLPDTVEAHRQLAEWCREQGLSAEREHHLRQVVRLAPDDRAARESLGYQRRGGRWMTQDQIMQARGMETYEGSYRSSQEIKLLREKERRERNEAHWHSELRRWRGWLNHRRAERVDQARVEIAAIDDPYAAPALVHWLDDETDEWTRRMLLDVLYTLDHPLAAQTLVRLALYDEDPELRLLCVDMLLRIDKHPPLKPFVDKLASKDNVIVNNAAQALAVINDAEAISPLIDALVTKHKFVIQPRNRNQFNPTFGNAPGAGGLSLGGNRAKVIYRQLENQDVWRALGKLTDGKDFGYDELAWRHWFVNEQKVDYTISRRDR